MIGRIGLAVAAASAAMAVAPGAAMAGGFSTVGLDSPPPRALEAGEAWEARFTVLAHGRTPLPNLTPVVRIERAGGGAGRAFPARETAKPGTYRARVTFPAEGRWTVAVAEHDHIRVLPHTFGEVRVGGRNPMTARLFVSIAVAVAGAAFAILALSGGDEEADQRATTADRADWSDQGRRVYAAMGCGSCHRLAAAGSTGTPGPDLDEALVGHDRESLVGSILRTQAKGFSAMPDDYGDRLTDTQLATLVSFLLASK